MNDITVHMIGNAHLDPVWLWHWQRGSDEALATCRAACDLLDDYPDVVFTRGEAWVYEQVRALDPDLFARVKRHIDALRWEVVGGWWVQPDCNLPTEEAILKTAMLGGTWFRTHLGIERVPVAYNVDSFGHGAYLPRMIRDAGQSYYVMMRPGRHEMELPSSLFRWRSPDGAEVLTYRIPDGYNGVGPDLRVHVERAVEAATPDVDHVMCFYGVGDHGGGPTRRAVEWIRANREFAPGVRLAFSSPSRFFAAAEPAREECPVVEGELQMHAIGCYSVCGELKRDIRRQELRAADLERLLATIEPLDCADERVALLRAWRLICFNQFHDVLPGSAISEAVAAARAQLGAAKDALDGVAHALTRRVRAPRAECALDGQRLHAVNHAAAAYRGLAECEVWLDWRAWEHHLEDGDGRVVPHQIAMSSALSLDSGLKGVPRVVVPLDVPPGERVSLRIVEGASPDGHAVGAIGLADGALRNGLVEVAFDARGVAGVRDVERGWGVLAAPVALECVHDESDTWSHNIDRYDGAVRATASFGAPVVVEEGALRGTVRLDGELGDTSVQLFVSLHASERVVRCRLSTNYRERFSVLKARVSPAGGVRDRRDRVAGGWIARACDGREHPLHHALACGGDGARAGMVLPDTFAVSCEADAIRPTLVRNSVHALHNCANHDLASVERMRERFGTDEGPQSIRFLLAFGDDATESRLEQILSGLQRPLEMWDDYCDSARLDRYR